MQKKKKEGYNPKAVEPIIKAKWERELSFEPTDDPNTFVMILPPPNVTGKLHIGHSLMISIQDCVARYQRFLGKNVFFLPGTDHAGIATQTVIERTIDKGLSRKEKLEFAWKWYKEHENYIFNQLKALGASCNFNHSRFTLDPPFNKAVNTSFIKLYNKKYIYRDYRVVNYCPKLNSVISDLEVDYLEVEDSKLLVDGKVYKFGKLYYFKYPVIDYSKNYDSVCKNSVIFGHELFKVCKECGGEEEAIHVKIIGYLEVATTRPETIHGDTALAINDKKNLRNYIKFFSTENEELFLKNEESFIRNEEIKAINPLNGLIIPIIKEQTIDISFGTGVMKVTPSHDFNDFTISKNHNLLRIDILKGNLILPTKTLRFEERIKIINSFKKNYLLIKEEKHKSSLPVCSRTGDVIEPILKSQWFIKMDKDVIIKRIKEIEFFPKEQEKVLMNWVNNIRDWCVSRQLWWGHQIPAYKVFYKNEFRDWIVCEEENLEEELNKFIDGASNVNKNEMSNKNDWSVERDTDVLDTWYSSSLCPLVHQGYPDKEIKPTSLLETGSDILFFWVVRMIYMSLVLEDTIPFNQVLLHGIIRDSLGRKMSKSLGNVIDPLFIINGCSLQDLNDSVSATLSEKERKVSMEYQRKVFPNGITECGADALRFGLLNYINDSKDINLDIKRVEGYRRFTNKIFNLFKYFNEFYKNEVVLKDFGDLSLRIDSVGDNQIEDNHRITKQTEDVNKILKDWINHKFNECLKTVTLNLEKYNFMDACISIYSFIIYDLCDVAVEISKEYSILDDTLMKNTLIVLNPFMPFITESLYSDILKAKWPVYEEVENNFDEILKEIKGSRTKEVTFVEKRWLKVVRCLTKKQVEPLVDDDGCFGDYIKYK